MRSPYTHRVRWNELLHAYLLSTLDLRSSAFINASSHAHHAQPHHSHRDEHVVGKEKPTLLTLPHELLNMIYGFVFDKPVFVRHWQMQCVRQRNAGIVLASKRTCDESSLLYYKTTIFDDTQYGGGGFQWWLKTLPTGVVKVIGEIRISADDNIWVDNDGLCSELHQGDLALKPGDEVTKE